MPSPKPDISMQPGRAPKNPPPGMSTGAKKIWRALAGQVPNLDPSQAEVLADFCHCLWELRLERNRLKREGTVIDTRRGPVKNPRMQAVRELRQAVQRYASEFGLTPVSAFKLAGGKSKKRQPGAEVLDGNWKPETLVN